MIDTHDITGLILAGGRGSRMGGVDKGLQNFRGMPLALHALMRLSPQVGSVMINANRNLSAYESFGMPVWPDGLADYAGPLAGFLCGLERCETPWLLTVPCDTPLFPADLASRLAAAAAIQGADIAMASAPEQEDDGSTRVRTQPVFCLLRVSLLESLMRFTQEGGRKIDRWTAQHPCAIVAFDQPGDDPLAFRNANTLAELHALEGQGVAMTREPAAAPRITVLAAAHAPAYKALRDEALRCAPEAFTSDYATAVQRPAQSYAPRLSMPADEGFFLGAWDADGALLGSIGCQREERAQQRHMATVVAMMVAPQAQRRGIGRQLLRDCLAQAERMAGLEQLVLTVTAGNAHAVRLYQRAGFTPYGLLPRAIVVAGVGHDKLHMLRLLPSSPLWQPIAPHEDH